MNKLYLLFTLLSSMGFLVSFSLNPPDGVTGAPGDSLCTECHIQTNVVLDGTIDVEGFPEIITPHTTYLLTIVNRNTVGNAIRAGFQMTILDESNTKAGEMAMPSSNSIVTNAMGRQYFEHNPAVEYPDSQVVRWTIQWTAPALNGGSRISWYVAGNIADGNFQNIGDRIVTATGNGLILISATPDLVSIQPVVYPNPGRDKISIELPDHSRPDGIVYIYNIKGALIGKTVMLQGVLNMPDMGSGIYILAIQAGNQNYVLKWSKY